MSSNPLGISSVWKSVVASCECEAIKFDCNLVTSDKRVHLQCDIGGEKHLEMSSI